MPSQKSLLIPLPAVLLLTVLLPAVPLLTGMLPSDRALSGALPGTHGSSPNGEIQAQSAAALRTAQKEWRLLFAGDILLSRNVGASLPRTSRTLAAALRPVFSGADWALGNLEGAVGSPDDCTPKTTSDQTPCFAVRGEHLALLKEMGFRAVGMENNHSLDLGPAGRETTRQALVQNGLTPLTLQDSPRFIRLDDITLGLVAFSTVPGSAGGGGDERTGDLRRKLRQARNLANFVVVYVHWGSEFLDWPGEKQRLEARRLVAHGVDMVVGHHPHVVQKPEILQGKPVYFSLGNLLFDQRYPATKEGLLADCRILGDTARFSALTVRTAAGSTRPSIEGVNTDAATVLAGCVLKAGPPLTVNGIVLRPGESSSDGRPPGLVLEAEKEDAPGRVLWRSPRARIASIEKMRTKETPRESVQREGMRGESEMRDYLFTLEPHRSSMDGEEALRPCVYDVRPEGFIPKWRGTALAWPLVDANLLPGEQGILCALHRGDSFIMPNASTPKRRVAAYRWNGFGFTGIHDPETVARCEACFD